MKWTLWNGGWQIRHVLARKALGDFAYITASRGGDLSVSCERCLRSVSPLTQSRTQAEADLLNHLRGEHTWRFRLGRAAPGQWRPLWA
jgi:hypothetical protein